MSNETHIIGGRISPVYKINEPFFKIHIQPIKIHI